MLVALAVRRRHIEEVTVTALLEGFRVLDLTDDYGAMASRVLAELGAEVVRVEVPGGGAGRRRAPVPGAEGLRHAHVDAGKAILTLDPSDAADSVTVEELLAGAHLAVLGAQGWGDGASMHARAVAERHPQLVVVSLTPFGLSGPAAGWRHTELVAQALAGVVYRAGVPELAPVAAPGSYCEDVGAVTAAMAGVIALMEAATTGTGQLIDVSGVLSLAQVTDTALPLWSLLRVDQVRTGAGLYPLFDCTDGLARIVLPMTPTDWRRLIEWLGAPPEWSGPEWDQPMLGPAERDQVLARLPARFAPYSRDEVTDDAEQAGVRVTPVLTPGEVLTNDHVVARETFRRHRLADGRDAAVFAGFFGVDGRRAGVCGPARMLDEAPMWPARPRPTTTGAAPGYPLAGLRVLELGTGVAAPEAGRVLAEWGADVVKVESRVRPDFQRRVLGSDMNPAFASPNRCKRALAADISNPAGRALIERLVPHVDVVLENSATGVLDRLGLGWEVLRAANPGIVLVGSQLYGDRGPWAWRKGYGPSARAVGGLTWLWAHGPESPRGVMAIHPDHFAGRLGALGAVAGLLHRQRTGVGCRIDLAQFEAVAGLLGDLFTAESVMPGAVVARGNRSHTHAPWGVYRCADDDEGAESWLALTVTTDDEWAAVVAVAGGALAAQPGWATEAGRLGDTDRLDEQVARWLRGQDAAALEVALQGAGVAAGRLLHPRLQATHPHYVARGYPVTIDQPGCGPLVLEGPAFAATLSGTPRCTPAPLPGEHTREVLVELLGADDDEIARLVQAGAIDEV